MNDAVEKALNNEPLLGFSFYTANQVGILKSLGSEIVDLLDSSIFENNDGGIRSENFTKLYGLFWLWTLGSFEVTSVMSRMNCRI